MYYILFHYTKKTAKGWLPCSIESKVIKFLHESYEDIEVDKIIEVKAECRLGLVVTEHYIKSELEPEEEEKEGTKSPPDNTFVAPGAGKKLTKAETIRQNKKTLEDLEAGEPSAMSKIADDIDKEMEEDLTDEQKDKAALHKADRLLKAERQKLDPTKKDWALCTECNQIKVAPWNEKGICSPCQKPPAKRKYERRKP